MLIPPLQPETTAYYAALLEAVQANQDFADAHTLLIESGARAGSPEDYALWSVGGYADAAERVVRDLPVWEVQA